MFRILPRYDSDTTNQPNELTRKKKRNASENQKQKIMTARMKGICTKQYYTVVCSKG